MVIFCDADISQVISRKGCEKMLREIWSQYDKAIHYQAAMAAVLGWVKLALFVAVFLFCFVDGSRGSRYRGPRNGK